MSLLVLSLPLHGSLYQVINSSQSDLMYALVLVSLSFQSSATTPLRATSSSLIYVPTANQCGISFDTFNVSATDGKATALLPAVVNISLQCVPGEHIRSETELGFMSILFGVFALVCCALAFWIVIEWIRFCLAMRGRNKRETVEEINPHANFLLLVLIVLGALMMTAALLTSVFPTSLVRCTSSRWLLGLGLGLTSAYALPSPSSLLSLARGYFGRQYVNWRRFSSRAFKRARLTLLNLLVRVGALVAVQVALLGVQQALAPPVLSEVISPEDPAITYLLCPLIDLSPFNVLWLAYQALVLLHCLFYSSVLFAADLSVGTSGAALTALLIGVIFVPPPPPDPHLTRSGAHPRLPGPSHCPRLLVAPLGRLHPPPLPPPSDPCPP